MTASPLRKAVPAALVEPLRRGRSALHRRRMRTYRLVDFQPIPKLVVPTHIPRRAAVPAIDAHNHLGRWLSRGRWMVDDVPRLIATMDELNIDAIVNLDGRWGDELDANVERYDQAYPGRFATFCHIDWSRANSRRFPADAVASLRRSAEAGAKGLKVWKDLGRSVRDQDGKLLVHDDPRLAEIWAEAGRLALPVLVHVGDPLAFFDATDCRNERLEELSRNPSASWHGHPLAMRALLNAFEAAVASNPGTKFIAAHVGNCAEDLDYVGGLLDKYPNLSIDLSGRMAELGRQPRRAALLIETHADRVLFGSDTFPWIANEIRTWFRFLETADEAFPYSSQPVPPQGRWTVSGLDLAGQTLAAVYAGNARALLPSLRSTARR